MADDRKLIFSGKFYEAWRAQIISGLLAMDNLQGLLSPEPSLVESEFVNLRPDQYQQKHKTHLQRQEIAKSFVFARVSFPILNTIRRAYTIRETLQILDDEYRPRSEAALSMARRRFYQERFVMGSDMVKFLRLFSENAERLRDAGQYVSLVDEVRQLIDAMPSHYDTAVTNYNMHVRDYGNSLQTLKRFLIDKYEKDLSDQELLPRYSSMSHDDADHHTGNRRQMPHRQNQRFSYPNSETSTSSSSGSASAHDEKKKELRCFKCTGFGHVQVDCPTKLREDETKRRPNETYEERKAKAHMMMVKQNGTHTIADQQRQAPTWFMLDSGAFKHIISNIGLLTDVTKLQKPLILSCASRDAPLVATHSGNLMVEVYNREGAPSTLYLREVLYSAELDVDLMSEHRITESGRYSIVFRKDYADVYDETSDEITFSAERQGSAKFVRYTPIIPTPKEDQSARVLNETTPIAGTSSGSASDAVLQVEPAVSSSETPVPPSVNKEKYEEEKWKWHRRLGHISGKYLKLLIKNKTKGIPNTLLINDDDFSSCEVCMMAKSTELGHNTVRRKAERRLEIVSSDILGPFILGKEGEKFVATFVDNFTNFVTIALLKRKGDVADAFARYHKRVEARFPDDPLIILRSDRAPEYIDGTFKRYCDQSGVTIEDSSPYAPQLNGVAERMNRTISERLRALLIDAHLPHENWPYAIQTAVYLVNRSPSRTNPEAKTPFEMWYNRPPDLSNLRIFGCIAHRHIPTEVRNQTATRLRRRGETVDTKLVPRTERRILIGYTDTGYVVLDHIAKKITHTCDVRFLEHRNITNFDEIVPENSTSDSSEQENVDQPDTPSTAAPTTNVEPDPQILQHTTDDHSYASYAMSIASNRRRILLEETVPTSYRQITGNLREADWQRAVDVELGAMRDHSVFQILDRKPNVTLVDTKWHFTVKYDAAGEPYAKARLVARGFRDRRPYSIGETYAPVVNWWLVRWALSIANRRKLKLVKLDVNTAFLHAPIPQTIYLAIPDGVEGDRETQMLKLKKSIYGLRTSSKNWYNTLHAALIDLQFLQTKADRCLYFRATSTDIALLLVYVDDILLVTNSDAVIEDLTTNLQQIFSIKVDYEPTTFVGFEITRNRSENVIYLSQHRYLQRILERFEMNDCHPQATPMETNLHLSKPSNGKDETEYRAMIGALLYAARGTRPDIAYAVNSLSRLQSSSSQTEKTYVRRIFRYIKGTLNYRLPFFSTGSKLEAYVDASYAPDVLQESIDLDLDLGKSISGYVLRLFGDPIHWAVRRQTIMASSSTAAELIALHDALDDIRFVYLILAEIFDIRDPVTVYEDNTNTTTIVMGGDHRKNRAVIIKCYDVLQAVHDEEITLRNVSTVNQLADGLTKALDGTKFADFVQRLFFPFEVAPSNGGVSSSS